LSLTAAPAAEPAGSTAERVGIYDSRIVAFAHFWSAAECEKREALTASAQSAKAAGEQARADELVRQILALQKRSHLQVFSTAPADEAMAALHAGLPAIRQELGVVRLISKWDEAALRDVAEANRIDATDRLTREFHPDAKRQKTIREMKKVKPLPLAEAKKLAEAGKL
jgi:hypothetical protein